MNDNLVIKEDITEFGREVVKNMGPKMRRFEKEIYLEERKLYWRSEHGYSAEESEKKALEDCEFSFGSK
ncbi:hypothetical protein [Leptospira interrogans]|uniref:hypothetical protein n=1 Tax=Leptospira interrogans TaxID=173 RepID=UPI0002BB1AED|nr:hypothetical protein [Leptospira interrogans]QOI36764.1 hypothetical protein LeptoLang_21475 [Leptospira interrogans serovar Icterohaemorrhagiae]